MPINENIVEYILVNKELGMSVGKIAGQVAHAQTLIDREYNGLVTDYFDTNYIGSSEEMNDYYNWLNKNNQVKVVLRAKESQLLKAIDMGGIPVHDNGKTEIVKGSLTVVAFRPQPKSNLENFTKRLQLL